MADMKVSLEPVHFSALVLLEARTGVPRKMLLELVVSLICDGLDQHPGLPALRFAQAQGYRGVHGGALPHQDIEQQSINSGLAERLRAWGAALQIPSRQLLGEALSQVAPSLGELKGFTVNLGGLVSTRFPGGIMAGVGRLQAAMQQEELRIAAIRAGVGSNEKV